MGDLIFQDFESLVPKGDAAFIDRDSAFLVRKDRAPPL